jgi:hypothetical protein
MTTLEAFKEIINNPNACLILDISTKKVIQYRYMLARNIVNAETMEMLLFKAKYIKISENNWQQPPPVKIFGIGRY